MSLEAFDIHPLIKKLRGKCPFDLTFYLHITEFEIEIESTFHKYSIDLLLGPISLKIINTNSKEIFSSFSGLMINHKLDGICCYRSDDGISLFTLRGGLKQKLLHRKGNCTELILYDHKGRKIKCYHYIDKVPISQDIFYNLLPSFKPGATERQFKLDIERIMDRLINNLKIKEVESYDYTMHTYERHRLNTDGYYVSDRQIRWTSTNNPKNYLYKYDDVCEERTSDLDIALLAISLKRHCDFYK